MVRKSLLLCCVAKARAGNVATQSSALLLAYLAAWFCSIALGGNQDDAAATWIHVTRGLESVASVSNLDFANGQYP